MISAAERMKALGKQPASGGAPSSLFGSAASLAQSIDSDEQYRIGFYPIVCNSAPEVAMGLASCLCYLLDQYRDTRVYRCFARIGDADGGGDIVASDYQFTIDDWELEGLADNIQVFGRLEHGDGDYQLTLFLDASLQGGMEIEEVSFGFPSLVELVLALPQVAARAMSKFDVTVASQAIIAYRTSTGDSKALEELLTSVFEWNLDIYLQLWGAEWSEADIATQFAEIAECARQLNDEFAAWCLGMAAKHVMQAGMEQIADTVVTQAGGAFATGPASSGGKSAAAQGFAQLGYVDRAVALLNPVLQSDATASVWLTLVAIYRRAGQMSEAIDTCQRALEADLDHPALFWEYTQLLMSAEAADGPVEELLLVDPDDYREELQITAEITSALKLYLATATSDLNALQLAIATMIDLDDQELWSYFEQLAAKDIDGEFTGEIIDRLLDLDDRDSAYDILERAADANAYAHVFLAQLAIADEDTTLALDTIAACRRRFTEIDDELEMELQRLDIGARSPDFEETFAEIKLSLAGNRRVSESQVEILEEAIGIAPQMVDLYVVLARCYSAWNDGESALEVLGEAESRAGNHPQLDLARARLMWARNERHDAIERLNSGLAAFPGDVNLLAQMAHFLIENGQLEDARQYILRAETIAPSHRAIWQVKRLVAQKMAEQS